MRRALISAVVLAATSFAVVAAAADADAPKAASVSAAKSDAGTGLAIGKSADGGTKAQLDIPKDIKKDSDQLFYVLGLSIGKGMSSFSPSPAELALIKRGLADGEAKPEKVTQDALQPWGPKVGELVKKRNEDKGAKFIEKAAKEKGAVKLDDGIIFVSEKEGTGKLPLATDKVKVNYRGTLVDGTEFDSSYKHGQPIEFELNKVIPCWTKGVQKIKVGGKAKLVCPSKTAYGERGSPPTIPGNSTLQFEIELLDANVAPPAAAPANLPAGMTSTPAKK